MPCRRHGLETSNFEAPAAKKPEIAARLEESGPGNHKAADAVAADSSHCIGHGGSGQPDRSIGDPLDVCDLRSPRGGFFHQAQRSGGKFVSADGLGSQSALLRGAGSLQGRCDKRDHPLKQPGSSMARLGVELPCPNPRSSTDTQQLSKCAAGMANCTTQAAPQRQGGLLYQLRHSGASWDRYRNYRDTLEVKLRGRWSSDSSFRRYEQHALVSQQFEQLPDSLKKRALAAPKHLRALVLGQCGLNGTDL